MYLSLCVSHRLHCQFLMESTRGSFLVYNVHTSHLRVEYGTALALTPSVCTLRHSKSRAECSRERNCPNFLMLKATVYHAQWVTHEKWTLLRLDYLEEQCRKQRSVKENTQQRDFDCIVFSQSTLETFNAQFSLSCFSPWPDSSWNIQLCCSLLLKPLFHKYFYRLRSGDSHFS